MHMADALITPTTATVMGGVALVSLGIAVRNMRREGNFSEEKISMMAITGAFVFAAQMINIAIPGTGSSGHIAGGLLLAAILGTAPAYITMAIILLIQALFFADGGLMAYGCNVINMGLCTSFIAYRFIFVPLIGKKTTAKRITIASIAAATLGLVLGAFFVVLETTASGITELPFKTFVSLMIPIHVVIGLIEGLITAAVLNGIFATKKEYIEVARENSFPEKSEKGKKVKYGMFIVAIITAVAFSLFASEYPDGLEWSIEKVTGTQELPGNSALHDESEKLVEKTAVMPDYAFEDSDMSDEAQTATAGAMGTGITILLAGGAGYLISRSKKNQRK